MILFEDFIVVATAIHDRAWGSRQRVSTRGPPRSRSTADLHRLKTESTIGRKKKGAEEKGERGRQVSGGRMARNHSRLASSLLVYVASSLKKKKKVTHPTFPAFAPHFLLGNPGKKDSTYRFSQIHVAHTNRCPADVPLLPNRPFIWGG